MICIIKLDSLNCVWIPSFSPRIFNTLMLNTWKTGPYATCLNAFTQSALRLHCFPTELTLVLLNKLSCHAHFQFSANQITWSRLLLYSHILSGKQCRSRSVGFFRSQLIWIYTVCKSRVYASSAGQGLRVRCDIYLQIFILQIENSLTDCVANLGLHCSDKA